MEDKKKKDWLFWLFLTVSAIWAIVVFWLLFDDQYCYNGSCAMKLNEVGDFLAGSFSPLAFFWLAYGYFMQNKELKNNTSESQKAYDLANNQLEFQIKVRDQQSRIEHNNSQPNIYIKNVTVNSEDPNGKSIISFKLINTGKEIRNLEFYNGEEKLPSSPIIEPITKEKSICFVAGFTKPKFDINSKYDISLELRVVFIDSLHNKQSTTFKMFTFLDDDELGYYATIEPTYIINHEHLYDN